METWKISWWQAMGYMFMIVFPTSILFVPGIVAKLAGTSAWLSLVFALAFGLLVALLSTALAGKYPDKTVIEFSVDILGFLPGKLVGFIYVFYFFYVAYIALRQFQALMSAAYLQATPPFVLAVVITLLSCLALYLGLEVIVRANGLIMFFNVISISIIFILFLSTVNWPNLKPELVKGVGPILNGALSPASWFGETAVILMLMPFLNNKSAARNAALLANLLLFLLLEMVIITVIGAFGPLKTGRLIFPLFTLLSYPPSFIQEFLFQPSSLFMAVWVSGILMKLTTFLFAGVYGLAQWFNLNCYRSLVLPAGAFVILLSFVSWPNVEALLDFSQYSVPASLTFVNFGLTLILYLFSFLRHKTGSNEGGTTKHGTL